MSRAQSTAKGYLHQGWFSAEGTLLSTSVALHRRGSGRMEVGEERRNNLTSVPENPSPHLHQWTKVMDLSAVIRPSRLSTMQEMGLPHIPRGSVCCCWLAFSATVSVSIPPVLWLCIHTGHAPLTRDDRQPLVLSSQFPCTLTARHLLLPPFRHSLTDVKVQIQLAKSLCHSCSVPGPMWRNHHIASELSCRACTWQAGRHGKMA